jgi:ribose transport system ATP-binding protein
MSDRILVMHEGSLAGELGPDDFTEENILTLASGLAKHNAATAEPAAAHA